MGYSLSLIVNGFHLVFILQYNQLGISADITIALIYILYLTPILLCAYCIRLWSSRKWHWKVLKYARVFLNNAIDD